MKIVLTDEKGICWKLRVTMDMRIDEILECIEKQYYSFKSKDSSCRV